MIKNFKKWFGSDSVKNAKYTPVIEYWDNAETCPFNRYQKFNKFFAESMEVGETPLDLLKRLSNALTYNENGDSKSVKIELTNLQLTLHNIMREYSPSVYAHAVMVKKIDGQEFNDITSGGLDNVIKKLADSGLSLEQIKKKINS